ncbi:MAG: hypothetical protein NC131_14355 [Roseburia sp.]|nr:hypothetical protein [Roseburia sp.]
MSKEYLSRKGTEALVRLVKADIARMGGSGSGGINWGSLRDLKFEVDPNTGELSVSSENILPGIKLENGYIYLTLEDGTTAGTVIGFSPRGEYVTGEIYIAMDIVQYQGSSFLCLQETDTEPVEGECWTLLASRGEKGDPGRDGQDGNPGSPGKDGEPGAKGDPGTDGTSAGFGTVTASVDSTTGTPNVKVTTDGPDTAKQFNFQFSGLKGEKGDPGEPGRDGVDGISSFNGRTGAVVPTQGDYSVDQVSGAAPIDSPTFLNSISLGRVDNAGLTDGTLAVGYNISADGTGAVATGDRTKASGRGAHAEGSKSGAYGFGAHAEGSSITAPEYSCLKVKSTDVSTRTLTFDTTILGYSRAYSKLSPGKDIVVTSYKYTNGIVYTKVSALIDEGCVLEDWDADNGNALYVVVVSDNSVSAQTHAEGCKCIATDYGAHAEGYNSVASCVAAHAEGRNTIANGSNAHAEGQSTKASGGCSHAEGSGSIADNSDCHAEGSRTTSSGRASHAEGYETVVTNGFGAHSEGMRTIASANAQSVLGCYNTQYLLDSGDVVNGHHTEAIFIVGKGTADNKRANAFRVGDAGVWASGNYNSSGADYAELFQWEDGNPDEEDRIGLFVTIDGEYIRLTKDEDDFILGIITGNPSVVGDVHDDQWHGMYLYDIYGRPLWDDVEIPEERDEEGNIITPAHTARSQKLNPDYDSSQKYLPRSKRPEWGCVGMMGKLVLIDDGTCQVNGWAKPSIGGVGTASDTPTKFRVMSRIDDTHVRVLIL